MAIPKLEDCNPGQLATGFVVTVVVEPVDDKRGNLFVPQTTVDKDQIVQTRGRIVSMGAAAFDYAHFPEGTKPQVGDGVAFAKLSGVQFDGKDGRKYRHLNDRDVLAIIEEDA